MKAAQKRFKKRPRGPALSPSQCPACDADGAFETKRKDGMGTLRGEALPITYDCQVCASCGHTFLTVPQMETRVRATVEAYQKKHGLLTANEMRQSRRARGFKTQQALVAAAPKIAIATLKRLEAGQRVQDAATDCLLRNELRRLEEKQDREALQRFLGEEKWVVSSETITVDADTFSTPYGWTAEEASLNQEEVLAYA